MFTVSISARRRISLDVFLNLVNSFGSFFVSPISTLVILALSAYVIPTLIQFVKYAFQFVWSSSSEISVGRLSHNDIEIDLRLCAVSKHPIQCSSYFNCFFMFLSMYALTRITTEIVTFFESITSLATFDKYIPGESASSIFARRQTGNSEELCQFLTDSSTSFFKNASEKSLS